ncbi:hypothetical protein TRV_04027 [Trichophyton verrucosum HKI 0517]|uniref:Uncharacterized protein n=1 Tax=Trichophyton verrucosum (strain HKI 0517) TaxID=663202 RepID=D4DA81_TRIVH|nr:uncharacterized protein TRV_04027 [Trichophyton verrucosum HKI 0517]EFE41232.1 hypothetical protein TRV_04027 [Trichophyton verrucosum HKI 0517]
MHGQQLIKLSTAGNRQEVPVPCITYGAMDTCHQTQQVESSCKPFVVSGSDVRRRQKMPKREYRSRDDLEISNDEKEDDDNDGDDDDHDDDHDDEEEHKENYRSVRLEQG